jgi:hypothetical protein
MGQSEQLSELAATEAPLRDDYELKRTRRKEIREQIELLVQEEITLIREIHAVSDQLESVRCERRDVLKPPRKQSRQRIVH